MKVIYKGVDITDKVKIESCSVKDRTGKTDTIDIVFNNMLDWYLWNPQEDDEISVENDEYSSGTMFVNTLIPDDQTFRIIASSLPCSARNKRNKSYINQTIESIVRSCALECGMDYQIYGIDKSIRIPYIERNNEGCTAFLQRLLTLEGATLKCINNRFVVIGIEYIQSRPATQTISLNNRQSGYQHVMSGKKLKGMTIKSALGEGSAYDLSVNDRHTHRILEQIPVLNDVMAYRWARNKLLDFNRKTESITFNSLQFNPKITSMIRIDIQSNTDSNGEWIVDEVVHDFIENKTKFSMYRCIDSIR